MTDTDKRPAARPDDKLARVPVRHVYFRDGSYTFAGIDSRYSTISNLKCYPENNNRTYAACSWIPAWQHFEFVFHTSSDAVPPAVRFVPAAQIAGWQREDAPPAPPPA